MKATLWLTSDYAQRDFINAETDDDRLKCCFVRLGELTTPIPGWTLVGEAEVESRLLGGEEVITNAVKAIDEQMQEIDHQYEHAIAKLEDLKRNLLCLPAPTTLTEEPSNV
jgi:hypothetical protein